MLTRDPDGPPGTVIYRRPDSRPAVTEPLPVSDPATLERALHNLQIGPDTITGYWDGSRLDLRDTVEILVLHDTLPDPDPAGSGHALSCL